MGVSISIKSNYKKLDKLGNGHRLFTYTLAVVID